MNGVVVLDKPRGITSTQALNKVKKILKVKKAGHTGTLDPFATGVLPLCFNQATKTIPYLGDDTKEYQAQMILGTSTDTMDNTGVVLQRRSAQGITRKNAERVFQGFLGEILQTPPMYSAAKVSGTRLYTLARAGKDVPRKPKQVFVKDIRVVDFSFPIVTFYVKCSRGTYIRVIASDVGEKLGCGACLRSLRRIRSGPFTLEIAHSIEDLEIGSYSFLGLQEVLSDYPRVDVSCEIASMIRNGTPLFREVLDITKLPEFEKKDIVTFFYCNKILSICEANQNSRQVEYMGDKDIVFRHLRVFN